MIPAEAFSLLFQIDGSIYHQTPPPPQKKKRIITKDFSTVFYPTRHVEWKNNSLKRSDPWKRTKLCYLQDDPVLTHWPWKSVKSSKSVKPFLLPQKNILRFHGIFFFFGSPAFIIKTLPILKCVRKTLWEPFPAVDHSALVKMRTLTFIHL